MSDLGKLNVQLSKENDILDATNQRLEKELQELKLEIAEVTNGRRIPISDANKNYISIIANLRTELTVIKRKLSKYESAPVTEMYGAKKKLNSTTAIVNKLTIKVEEDKEIEEVEKEVRSEEKEETVAIIADEEDAYAPQVARRPRMRVDDAFSVLSSCFNGRKLTKNQITAKTGLSDGQICNVLEKYNGRFIIERDPDFGKRFLYSLNNKS